MSNETACVTRRAKGDGTIFQNKKGRWIARYKRKGFPPKEFSGKTMAEAQAKMDEYKFLVLSGNIVNHLLPLEEYAVKFLNYKSKQVKRGTIKQATYDRIEATYENQIHDNPIVKILMCNLTGKDIQDFIDDLQDKYSYSTIKKCYEFFLALITYGLDDGDFDRILKVCNMQHYSTHSLRHTFATKLLEKTKNLRDIKTVAAIMGDDYKVIIKTYLHPDEDNKYHCPSTILPPYEVILFVLKRFLTELSMKN